MFAAVLFLLTACSGGANPQAVTVTVTSPDGPSTTTSDVAAPSMASPTQAGPRPAVDGDGTYLVGADIMPGIYRTPGGSRCYWARLNSLDTSDIIDNNNSTGPQVIEILPSDRAFQTRGCQQWTLEASQNSPVPAAPTPPPAGPQQSPGGGSSYEGMSCSYRAALTLRTAQSAVLICDEGSGIYTYEGLRLKDNARISLPGVVPTASGFSVTNNGTRYDISPRGLIIYTDGEVYTEPAIAPGQ